MNTKEKRHSFSARSLTFRITLLFCPCLVAAVRSDVYFLIYADKDKLHQTRAVTDSLPPDRRG